MTLYFQSGRTSYVWAVNQAHWFTSVERWVRNGDLRYIGGLMFYAEIGSEYHIGWRATGDSSFEARRDFLFRVANGQN